MDFGQSIKLLVFDFDGTLFHLDIDWPSLKSDLGDPEDMTLGQRIQQYNQTGHPDLQKVTDAEVRAVGEKRIEQSVVKTLQALSRRFALAILTRNSRHAVECSLAGTELEGKLFIVGREAVKQLKPHPEGLHIILDHFGVTPAETVLVGDTHHDVEGAHHAGAQVVIVENNRLPSKPPGADYYIKDISELIAI